MRLLVVLCVALVVDGALSAVASKQYAKIKDDEDTYGALDESDGDIQKDQVEYYDENEDEETPADPGGSSGNVDVKIISKAENFVQEIGSVVRLPCLASSKDELVRVWAKESKPIYQSFINIGNKPNYKLFENGTLEVVLEDASDFGTYTCKLAVSENSQPEVAHTVVQKTSPVINELFTNNQNNVFNVGDVLTLICRASGYPKPRISWHKNNDRLGTEGETLVIQSVKPKHAGGYRCLADNGIGRPNHKHIEVFVNHPPMVSVENYVVNTDHGSDAELICDVKAYPSAVVNWQRGGRNIAVQDNKIELQRHRNNERNILIIKNIEEGDFGQYSCVASNAFGKQMRSIDLVKTPVMRQFEKQVSNETTKDVVLQWKVESKQPVSMHELQYRKKGEASWKTITPEVSDGDDDIYLIEHTLRNLEPGTYETRARSKNSHGWSDYSDIVPFEEAKHGSHHPKAKHIKKEPKDNRTQDPSHDTPAQHRSGEMSPVGESTSSSTSLSPSIAALIALSLLTLHARQ